MLRDPPEHIRLWQNFQTEQWKRGSESSGCGRGSRRRTPLCGSLQWHSVLLKSTDAPTRHWSIATSSRRRCPGGRCCGWCVVISKGVGGERAAGGGRCGPLRRSTSPPTTRRSVSVWMRSPRLLSPRQCPRSDSAQPVLPVDAPKRDRGGRVSRRGGPSHGYGRERSVPACPGGLAIRSCSPTMSMPVTSSRPASEALAAPSCRSAGPRTCGRGIPLWTWRSGPP